MIEGSICRAGRALVEVSRAKLALRAKVDEAVIERFERGIDIPDDRTRMALKTALEELGALFLPEEGARGIGVRLKFNRSVTKRLGTLENEGGIPAKDDIQ